jgi:hypothetical protein
MNRNGNNLMLYVMLNKLEKDQIIDSMITIINHICEEDEDLKRITHEIITCIQVKEIFLGRDKLEDYVEPHRTELRIELEKLKLLGVKSHEEKRF